MILSDASSFFVAMRVWEEHPFHEGDSIDEQAWQSILDRTDLLRARGIALSLLARTEHSRFLLDQKLRQRDIPQSAIAPVLDELEQSGALSDERYARSWLRSRTRSHPEGESHLIAGLRSRGISESLARASLAAVLQEESLSLEEIARGYAGRITRRKALDREQLASRLYRRGFSREVVTRVLESESPHD